MRSGRFLALALVLGAPAVAAASDAPHNLSAPDNYVLCQNCHTMHMAQGAGLVLQAGNYNNCYSCHNSFPDPTGSGSIFGGSWATDQATPGIGGRSHRWDAVATNLGATPPDPASVMGGNLDQGKLMCSTCHDQHTGASRNMAGSPQHTSAPIVDPGVVCTTVSPHQTCVEQTFGQGPTKATLQLLSVGATSPPQGFQVKVTATTPAPEFKISHDKGYNWYGWSSNTWVLGAAAGKPIGTLPATHALDDSAVSVKFNNSGTLAVGDTFEFYVSYPFLIMGNIDSAMCKVCHQDRLMKYQDVEGGVANGFVGDLSTVTLGQTVFHHPTGQTLGAKTLVPPDRTASTMLDADGSAQSLGTDPNKTNNLNLGVGNTVHCMTCHQPHVADSNSLTIDQRTPIRNDDQ